MTVAEYDAKFMELSRFGKCLIATEEMKASKFERGLRPTIREKIVALRIRKYSDMVDSAMSVEREREDFQKIQERSRGSHKNQNCCPSNNKRQRGGQDSSGGSFEGNFNKAPDECFIVERRGISNETVHLYIQPQEMIKCSLKFLVTLKCLNNHIHAQGTLILHQQHPQISLA
ncbi:uncharacterized protein LOC132269740 [Cornus florida]|uniref:uncharacterized protein LOC132269740 n=1 Tax=Cornus florida TaxID=4283 RepID=UPI00289E592A|nr:uncharacterized protein LOC132269740 [Cornus florida]